MNELERASKLIGDIYDAALDPALWPSVFEVNTQPFLVDVNSDAAPSSGDPFRVARMASRTPMARRRAVSMTDRMSA